MQEQEQEQQQNAEQKIIQEEQIICNCYACRIMKNNQQKSYFPQYRDQPQFSNQQEQKNEQRMRNFEEEYKESNAIIENELEKITDEYNQIGDYRQQKENYSVRNEIQEFQKMYSFNLLEWITQFPKLAQIKSIKQCQLDTFQSIKENYATHDESIPEISFHFNPDGSQAILFSVHCNLVILNKIINTRDDFIELLYDNETLHLMVLIGKKLNLDNFDQNSQKYENDKLPLNTFISLKFEDQQKILNKIGIYRKKQILSYSGIENLRLRNDLLEMYQCLSDDLEFMDMYSSDHCFIYYLQSDNMSLLQAMIVGPQDTPYQGIPYTLTVKIPEDYPNVPPNIIFDQQILHPNISDEGKICLDILQDKWSSALTLQKVLISIVSLLYEKNLDDVYNHYAKRLYIEDPEQLKKQIRQQAIQSGCFNLEIDYNELDRLTQLQKIQKETTYNYNDEDEEAKYDGGYADENEVFDGDDDIEEYEYEEEN